MYIETEAKGTPDILDFVEVHRRIQTALTDFVPPAHAGTLCFWGEESTYDHVEVDYGQGVRLKTRGDSPFLGENFRLICVQVYIHSLPKLYNASGC